jgi:transposase
LSLKNSLSAHHQANDRLNGLPAFEHLLFLIGHRFEFVAVLVGARFVWPVKDSAVARLTVQQLHWLLEGIDLAAMRCHAAVSYQKSA